MGMWGNGKPPQWEWELPALPWEFIPKGFMLKYDDHMLYNFTYLLTHLLTYYYLLINFDKTQSNTWSESGLNSAKRYSLHKSSRDTKPIRTAIVWNDAKFRLKQTPFLNT